MDRCVLTLRSYSENIKVNFGRISYKQKQKSKNRPETQNTGTRTTRFFKHSPGRLLGGFRKPKRRPKASKIASKMEAHFSMHFGRSLARPGPPEPVMCQGACLKAPASGWALYVITRGAPSVRHCRVKLQHSLYTFLYFF